jgi:uncharacterized delta-60 repeat protein
VGKLDRAFGRNGKLLITSGPSANALAIQADGKLVVAGSGGGGFALARYTQRGRLDRSFGRGGKVVTPFGRASSSANVNAAAIQPDRKIVVAGWPLRPPGHRRSSRLPATTQTARSIAASAITGA